MHVKRNDTVVILSGKNAGKRGRVLEVNSKHGYVRVEKMAMVKRHTKPGRSQASPMGGIVEKPGRIDASNVLVIDKTTDAPTRVGKRVLEDGRKVRISRKSGNELE